MYVCSVSSKKAFCEPLPALVFQPPHSPSAPLTLSSHIYLDSPLGSWSPVLPWSVDLPAPPRTSSPKLHLFLLSSRPLSAPPGTALPTTPPGAFLSLRLHLQGLQLCFVPPPLLLQRSPPSFRSALVLSCLPGSTSVACRYGSTLPSRTFCVARSLLIVIFAWVSTVSSSISDSRGSPGSLPPSTLPWSCILALLLRDYLCSLSVYGFSIV